MGDRPARPKDTPWMMPYLIVRDVEATQAFYEKAFGFTPGILVNGPDGKPGHGESHHHDQRVMYGRPCGTAQTRVAPAVSGTASAIEMFFYVEDVDAAYQRALDAGCESQLEPADMFWGDRIGTVIDPDGYSWTLATNVADFDPSNMPH